MERHGAEGEYRSEAGSKGEGRGALCVRLAARRLRLRQLCAASVWQKRRRQAWSEMSSAKTSPPRCWQESVDAHGARLKACAAWINANYDVAGRCRELPDGLAELDRRKGGRLAT